MDTKEHAEVIDPPGSSRWVPFEGPVTVVRHDPSALLSFGRPVGVIVRAADGEELLTGTDSLYTSEVAAEEAAASLLAGEPAYRVRGDAHGSTFDETFPSEDEATAYASAIMGGDVDSTVYVHRIGADAGRGVR